MKKIVYILIMTLLAGVLPGYAQDKPKKSRAEMHKEMVEFKTKYIAQEMELTGEQKEKFAPLYEQMDRERWQLFRETRALEKKLKNDKTATDADYESVVKALNQAKEKGAEIEKNYNEKFQKFLTAKQMYKMKEAEDAFNQRMMKMRMERKQKMHTKQKAAKQRIN